MLSASSVHSWPEIPAGYGIVCTNEIQADAFFCSTAQCDVVRGGVCLSAWAVEVLLHWQPMPARFLSPHSHLLLLFARPAQLLASCGALSHVKEHLCLPEPVDPSSGPGEHFAEPSLSGVFTRAVWLSPWPVVAGLGLIMHQRICVSMHGCKNLCMRKCRRKKSRSGRDLVCGSGLVSRP